LLSKVKPGQLISTTACENPLLVPGQGTITLPSGLVWSWRWRWSGWASTCRTPGGCPTSTATTSKIRLWLWWMDGN